MNRSSKTLRLWGEDEAREVVAEFMITTEKCETVAEERERVSEKKPVPTVTCMIAVVR